VSFLDGLPTRTYDPWMAARQGQDAIRELFEASIRTTQVFLEERAEALERAIGIVAGALDAGRKLLFFGNGGSAADAQHLAAEFVGRFLGERRPLPAVALTTDTSALTAIANDYGFEHVFARQVRALGVRGDVALAISTSGRSPNVLRAVEACRELGVTTIGLTGGDGGALAGMVDVELRVSASTLSCRIQETHILIGHVICELVDRRLGEPA
jgi:D-sedoheptulose 7-phosphate isomerase